MRFLVLSIVILVGCQKPNEITNGKDLKTESVTNSIGMKLVLIPGGTFTMGSPDKYIGKSRDETQHKVTISKSFYLGIYEVTQEEYEKVMGNNPSRLPHGAKFPVNEVTWHDAILFCNRLSDMPEEKSAGREYRLPTEAEWEYACRAGSETAYSFSASADTLGENAWHGENGQGKTHSVGGKKPNRWGLYDMHGNVSEWCQDLYGDYPLGAVTDPQGAINGWKRVLRGGSWGDLPGNCKSSWRDAHSPDLYGIIGLRVALSASDSEASAVEQQAAAMLQTPPLRNSVGVVLKLLPPGTFKMGEGSISHAVTLTNPVYIGVYEVNQEQYKEVMRENPSGFVGDHNPVESVSWDDAVEFCLRLSELPAEKASGRVYRLPTEVEWEYACRAGSETDYSFSASADTLGEHAWYGESVLQPHPIGEKKPNRWGLFDMHGNVWEWCADWDGDYQSGATTDLQSPNVVSSPGGRVIRGGSFGLRATLCRSASRLSYEPTNRSRGLGFRLALSPSKEIGVQEAKRADEGTEGATAEQRPEMP